MAGQDCNITEIVIKGAEREASEWGALAGIWPLGHGCPFRRFCCSARGAVSSIFSVPD